MLMTKNQRKHISKAALCVVAASMTLVVSRELFRRLVEEDKPTTYRPEGGVEGLKWVARDLQAVLWTIQHFSDIAASMLKIEVKRSFAALVSRNEAR